MPSLYKVLGQEQANTNATVTLYTVPAATQAIISTVNVCNISNANTTFSLAVRPAGATLQLKHYLNFNTIVPGQDSINISLGLTMGNTDVLTGYSNLGNVVFNVFGTEIT